MNHQLTTTEKSSTLAVRITEAEDKLRVPKRDEIISGIGWLMKTGMGYPTTIPAGEETAAYVSVLQNVPVCGLRKALSKLRNGEYENINLAFIPLPAELAAMSRAEAKTERDDLIRLKETANSMRPAIRETVSEEGKAKVRNLLAAFRANNAARKLSEAGEVAKVEPTQEQLERWEKIRAMPSAPSKANEAAA